MLRKGPSTEIEHYLVNLELPRLFMSTLEAHVVYRTPSIAAALRTISTQSSCDAPSLHLFLSFTHLADGERRREIPRYITRNQKGKSICGIEAVRWLNAPPRDSPSRGHRQAGTPMIKRKEAERHKGSESRLPCIPKDLLRRLHYIVTALPLPAAHLVHHLALLLCH